MPTESSEVSVAKAAYTTDTTRSVKTDIEDSATELSEQATDIAEWEDTSPKTIDEIAQIIANEGYSSLTDEEIDEYVQYMAQVSATNTEISAQRELLEEQHAETLATLTAQADQMAQTFVNACAVSTTFRKVNGDGEVVDDEQA